MQTLYEGMNVIEPQGYTHAVVVTNVECIRNILSVSKKTSRGNFNNPNILSYVDIQIMKYHLNKSHYVQQSEQ